MKPALMLTLFASALFAANPNPATAAFVTAEAKPASMGTLTFGPDGVLFVGDQIGGAIYALNLGDNTPNNVERVSVEDIESKVGSLIGADSDDVLVHDMAVNPISRNTYITVSRARGNWNSPWMLPNDLANASVLLKITPDGSISEVSLSPIAHSVAKLPNPIDAEAVHKWKKTKKRADAITDLAFADGKLYVAGLSNEEFASTMHIIPFPFEGKVNASSLEVFHGAHGKYETHAPVRAFLPQKLNGQDHILAAYLCTPLALFPTEDLKPGAHVKGRTLAELGNGNYPLDMVPYKKEGKDYVFLINSQRANMRFSLEDLSTTEISLTTQAGAGEGMPFDHLRGQGLLQADAFSDTAVMVMQRGAHGRLDLGTLPTRAL